MVISKSKLPGTHQRQRTPALISRSRYNFRVCIGPSLNQPLVGDGPVWCWWHTFLSKVTISLLAACCKNTYRLKAVDQLETSFFDEKKARNQLVKITQRTRTARMTIRSCPLLLSKIGATRQIGTTKIDEYFLPASELILVFFHIIDVWIHNWGKGKKKSYGHNWKIPSKFFVELWEFKIMASYFCITWKVIKLKIVITMEVICKKC